VKQFAREKEKVELVLLAGSQARNFSMDSDVDIIVVKKDSLCTEEIVESIAKISLAEGILIHPVILSEKQYLNRIAIGFYQTHLFRNARILYKHVIDSMHSLIEP
jgi:predicted nucleotidyltransferase